MNASFGDIFNDGRLSIYKTNISEPGVLVQANDLWVPKARAAGAELEFENLASTLGVDLGGWSWGAQFGDLNNDGTLDMYLVNGYVSAGERTSYWYDFAEIAVGHKRIIGDASNWPPMRGRSLSGYQHKRVWINDGVGRFTEVAQDVGASDTYDGRAVALADLSNRGALDVIVANQRGPLLVYANTVSPGRHWIAFELEGTVSNRSAIGARVEVQWNGQRQVQEVSGGSGFSAQNQRRLHYGLGSTAEVGRVMIRWPSGRTETIERPAARPRASREGIPMSTRRAAPARSLRRGFRSRQPAAAADPHHVHPDHGAPQFRHPRSLRAHRARHRHGDRRRARAGPHHVRQVAAPGERVHLGHQRRHPGQVAVSVAVLLREPDFDPVQVRAAAQRPAPVESVESRRERGALSRAADRVAPQHSVGEQPVADGGHLAARIRDRLARRPAARQRLLCRRVRRVRVRSQRHHRQPVAVDARANHRPDVSALHFLHGDRPQGRRPAPSGARSWSSIAVAFVEMLLRLNEVIYAPFYALFLVGPSALLIEMAHGSWLKDQGSVRAQGSGLRAQAKPLRSLSGGLPEP